MIFQSISFVKWTTMAPFWSVILHEVHTKLPLQVNSYHKHFYTLTCWLISGSIWESLVGLQLAQLSSFFSWRFHHCQLQSAQSPIETFSLSVELCNSIIICFQCNFSVQDVQWWRRSCPWKHRRRFRRLRINQVPMKTADKSQLASCVGHCFLFWQVVNHLSVPVLKPSNFQLASSCLCITFLVREFHFSDRSLWLPLASSH